MTLALKMVKRGLKNNLLGSLVKIRDIFSRGTSAMKSVVIFIKHATHLLGYVFNESVYNYTKYKFKKPHLLVENLNFKPNTNSQIAQK